jgi:hypothetical protein
MKKVFKYFLLFGLGFSSLSLQAQDKFAEEVSSIDNIITALYASISGEKGEPRQWEMFHSLFTENAQLIPTGKNEEGVVGFRSWTPKQYEEQANEWLVSEGFHETETFRVTESFGPVTHIFSTYDSRNSVKDEKPFARGINSIQLLNDGNRWWIMTIYWSSETSENPIPSKYLAK